MAVIIDMEMPTECYKCGFFEYEGILCKSPTYFLDAFCDVLVHNIGHDVTKKEHYPYTSGKSAIAKGERWKHCPLREYVENEDDGR